MQATTEILCRYDAAQQVPVVFLRDTITPDNKIQVWNGQGKPVFMPLDYYKMTSHLSAADERVLMERFKEATGRKDMLVHINHRLPRNARPTPNLLATENAAPSILEPKERKSSAKSIDTQPLPPGPEGDVPQAGETPAAPAANLDRRASDRINETPGARMWRSIEELQLRMAALTATQGELTARLHDTNVELETTKQACTELIAEYNAVIEQEAQETLRKQKEALAALTAIVAPQATETQAPAPEPVAETVPEQAEAPTDGPKITVKRSRSGQFTKK